MTSNTALTDSFLGYLQRTARAKGTQAMYGSAVRELASFAAGRPLPQLGAADIDGFLVTWRKDFSARYGRPPSPATYRTRVKALRAFYGWMELFDLLVTETGSYRPNPMRRIVAPKPEQRRNDWLRPAEDTALMTATMSEAEAVLIWSCAGQAFGSVRHVRCASQTSISREGTSR